MRRMPAWTRAIPAEYFQTFCQPRRRWRVSWPVIVWDFSAATAYSITPHRTGLLLPVDEFGALPASLIAAAYSRRERRATPVARRAGPQLGRGGIA